MRRTSLLLVFGFILTFTQAQVPGPGPASASGSDHQPNLLSHSVWFFLSQVDTGAEEETGGEDDHVELFTTPTTKMGAATSDFGYNLFRALASREAATNVFLAPLSVSAALTQLSMGEDTTHTNDRGGRGGQGGQKTDS